MKAPRSKTTAPVATHGWLAMLASVLGGAAVGYTAFAVVVMREGMPGLLAVPRDIAGLAARPPVTMPTMTPIVPMPTS